MSDAAPKTQTPLERLDALFAPFGRSDLPGLAVGVMFKGEVVYRKGFGMASLEHFTANAPGVRMRIGSTTKHMTALLALLLVEDGKLDLDRPIRTYLPELTGPAGDPSIRLLLQHRGGGRCHLDLGFIAHGLVTPRNGFALDVLTRQTERNFPVGESMIYNNGGYHLTSIAIERVGGAPLAAQLKERLFAPLGMDDTILLPSDHIIAPGMATLHVPGPDGSWRRGLFPSEEVLGEGGVVSTVDDMLKWMRHLKSRHVFGRAASWAQLFETPTYSRGEVGPYGLGMMVVEYRGRRLTHHAGGVVGGVSQMALYPDDDLEIVILCNGAPNGDPVALAERVADILLEDRLGPVAEKVSAAPVRSLLGQWWSKETGLIYGLSEEDEKLRLSLLMAPTSWPLLPDGDGKVKAQPLAQADVFLDLGAALASGKLPIRFGGETSLFERLPEKGAFAAADLAARAAGTYACPEAGCTAKISQTEAGLELVFADPFGTSTCPLTPYGTDVGVAEIGPFSIALAFDGADGPAPGFRVNSGRTRQLRFTRT